MFPWLSLPALLDPAASLSAYFTALPALLGEPWRGLEPLAISAGVVALAEIGDKTQLLAMLLAARFRRPLPIILAILTATVANHAAAAFAGRWLGVLLAGPWLSTALIVSFLGAAVWALIPDKVDEGEAISAPAYGVFIAAAVSFFLAEIGDKTQMATMALAAKFDTLLPVVAGTTLGMLIADVPVVLIGHRAVQQLPLRAIRVASAAVFVALALAEAAKPLANAVAN